MSSLGRLIESEPYLPLYYPRFRLCLTIVSEQVMSASPKSSLALMVPRKRGSVQMSRRITVHFPQSKTTSGKQRTFDVLYNTTVSDLRDFLAGELDAGGERIVLERADRQGVLRPLLRLGHKSQHVYLRFHEKPLLQRLFDA